MRIIILKTITAAVCLMFLFSCTGETGEQGPAGPAGSDADTMEVMHFEYEVFPSFSYKNVKDTYIVKDFPDDNLGGCTLFLIGGDATSRGLLYFGLAGHLGPGMTVKKSYLTLYINHLNHGPCEIECRKIETYNWIEGTECIGSDEDGATWNTYDSTNSWDMDSGSFFDTPLCETVTVDSTGYVTFELDSSIVQGWIDDPSDNHGMMLKIADEATGDDYLEVEANSGASPCMKPRLTIYYESQE